MCSESGSERNGVVCVAKCVSMFYVSTKILFYREQFHVLWLMVAIPITIYFRRYSFLECKILLSWQDFHSKKSQAVSSQKVLSLSFWLEVNNTSFLCQNFQTKSEWLAFYTDSTKSETESFILINYEKNPKQCKNLWFQQQVESKKNYKKNQIINETHSSHTDKVTKITKPKLL